MDVSPPAPAQDWSSLLDELKQAKGITSDAKLAAELGVTRGYICSVRKGRKGLSINLAQTVFSKLGRTFETKRFERLFVPVKVQLLTKNLAGIRKHVIERAHGHCQLCGCAAPFKDSEGHPYLEVHHVIPIRDGGKDSLDNLVALCPNCHRKMDVNQDAADKKKLQNIIKRYK